MDEEMYAGEDEGYAIYTEDEDTVIQVGDKELLLTLPELTVFISQLQQFEKHFKDKHSE